MAFGPSGAQKQGMGNLNSLISSLTDTSKTAQSREGATFKQFEKSLTPALDYWKKLATGDKATVTAAEAPDLEAATSSASGSLKSLAEYGPRGGGSTAAAGAVTAGRDKAVGDLYSGARTKGTQGLEGLAGLYGQMSTAQGSESLGALTGAAGAQTGALSILDQWQQNENSLWGSIGGGIGGLLGMVLTGGAGGGGGLLGKIGL